MKLVLLVAILQTLAVNGCPCQNSWCVYNASNACPHQSTCFGSSTPCDCTSCPSSSAQCTGCNANPLPNGNSEYNITSRVGSLGGVVDDWIAGGSAKENVIFQYGSIENWDLSQTTNMDFIFNGKPDFNDDISKWYTGNVTSFNGMFYQATSFNGDLSLWNVGGASNIKDMRAMFYRASSFNGDLSQWDVSSVTDMNYMFNFASAFSRTLCNEWVTSAATQVSMFDGSDGGIATKPC